MGVRSFFKSAWKSFKKVLKGIWSGVSAVFGFIFGNIIYWIFLGILYGINIGKKRIKLSSCLQGVLSTYYPTINLDKVTIIVNANGIPFGKRALTESYDIFWKYDFSENKTKDLKTLLHELVHVRQYHDLTMEGFCIAYSYEYMNEMFSYSNMPIEKEAADYVVQIYDGFLSNFKTQCNPNLVTERDLSDWAWLLM